MKKIFAMILALSLTVGMFTACGSETTEDTSKAITSSCGSDPNEDTSGAVTSSMTAQEQKELLKENNEMAKLLLNTVRYQIADYAVIGIMYSLGTYKFTLAEASEAENVEGQTSDGTKKLLQKKKLYLI